MEKQKENPNNPVGWFEIYVDDMERAKAFYKEILQVPLEDMPMATDEEMEMVAFPMKVDKPNASGALVKMDGFKPGGTGTLVYFSSWDCSIEEGRVKAAGGEVINTKSAIGEHGFISLCKDTEGNMFGIHSMS